MIAPVDFAGFRNDLGDADFRRLAAFAQREFGLSLSETKKPLLQSRLSKRLRVRGLDDFGRYLDLLERDAESGERQEFISALTTNVTSFFREKHHFDQLRSECLPNAIARAKSGGRVRIWSAGCSSGQEAYSIAMVMLDLWPDAPRHDVRILATDIDAQVVARAREGVYPVAEANTIPETFRTRFLSHGTEPRTSIRVDDALRGLVTFAELNLMAEWPFGGPFDAIFCRNVAIYFDTPTQQALWTRLAVLLRDGGHLFIGHSERVTGAAAQSLVATGLTSYRRTGSAPAATAKGNGA